MANRIDNSLAAFSSRPNLTTQTVLTVVVGLFLIVGLILSVAQQQWPFTALFGFALIGTAMIGGLSFVRLRRETAAADSARLDWHTALPEVQRQSLQIEVRELARVMEAEAPQAADLQSAYIVAEDLALRQIQQEENIPLLRHISIGKVPFDAVFIKNDILHCCEVSFLIAPDFRQDKIDAMLRKAAATREMLERLGIKMRVRLIVVLITQLTPEDDDLLRSTLRTKRFSATPVDVDIRFLDFEALQGIYITD
jgi:hypothetical protein